MSNRTQVNNMNILLTALSSHMLSIIESIVEYEEPTIVAALQQEISLLITKLESYIATKSPATASLVTPIVASVRTGLLNSQSQGSSS